MKFSISAVIYKTLIDPILTHRQKHIISAIGKSDRVLDIACGTGSLSISASKVAKEVRGIDLAEEMLEIAKNTAVKQDIRNISFSLQDASDLSGFKDNSFDIAVTSMAIHQFDKTLAIKILNEMKRIAGRIIIMDYQHPGSPGLSGAAINIVEWIAGGDHFRNFRIYKKMGGLDYFISQAGLNKVGDLYLGQSFCVVECRGAVGNKQ